MFLQQFPVRAGLSAFALKKRYPEIIERGIKSGSCSRPAPVSRYSRQRRGNYTDHVKDRAAGIKTNRLLL